MINKKLSKSFPFRQHFYLILKSRIIYNSKLRGGLPVKSTIIAVPFDI